MDVEKLLESLYKQMETELRHLNSEDKQRVRKYMIFAFDRGTSAAYNETRRKY